jgi:hypothetical protein
MKFDVRVTVEKEEVNDMINITQSLNIITSIYGLNLDSEYVQQLDDTFEFRYKFDLNNNTIKQIYNDNEMNLVDFLQSK